jgi:hypothetical protein
MYQLYGVLGGGGGQGKALKPYTMMSQIEGFEGMIMANKATAEGEDN